MLRGFGAALAKDLRLLARDRVGLVFLIIAPMVVITVAGLSLASLYGVKSAGDTVSLLPIVDNDGGWVGRAIAEHLAHEPDLETRAVSSTDDARDLVRRKQAAVALVIPAGTSAAIADGGRGHLVLYTDPVRWIERGRLYAVVQDLRHGLEAAAHDEATVALAGTRTRTDEARAALARSAQELDDGLARLRSQLADLQAESERRVAGGRHELAAQLARVAAERRAEASARLATVLAPLRGFLADLARSEQAFGTWLDTVRERAGRFADRIPPPPAPPAIPPELTELAHMEPQALVERLLPADDSAARLPSLPHVDPLPLPAFPRPELPSLPELPALRLPGLIDLEETSVTGAPHRLNPFDQNVPGFSITFLLLGVLLGVSLGFLDERDWGTLARLRTTPTPLAAVVLAKLAARFAIGLAQMLVLFAVGRAAFGVSLGRTPWALLLPTTGIVFAGTAFGLVVAGLTQSREAVLPLGSIVILTMAAMGGCWWPLDLEPRWMQRAALVFPTTWAMDAYNDLMIRRQPAPAVLAATGVLAGFGVLYLALGLVLFRHRVRQVL